MATVCQQRTFTNTNFFILHFVGPGIYVQRSLGSAVSGSYGVQGPQPSSSYALVDVGYASSLIYTRLNMYCCSNTTNPSASFTYPDGHVSSGSYWGSQVQRHTGSSAYAGCYQFYYSFSSFRSYSFGSSGYAGIYACSMSDSRGRTQVLNIGLYDQGFSSEWVVHQNRP